MRRQIENRQIKKKSKNGGWGRVCESAIFEHKVSIINLCNKTIVKTYGTAYVHMQYCSCFFVSKQTTCSVYNFCAEWIFPQF